MNSSSSCETLSQKTKKQIKFDQEPSIIRFSQDQSVFVLKHQSPGYIWDSNCPDFQTDDQFIEALDKQGVLLRKLRLQGSYFSGLIAVKNISFKKEICVRYSFDNWLTIQEQQASFCTLPLQLKSRLSYIDEHVFDTFVFEIDLEEYFNRDCEVKFAIRYKTDGQIFWDNNYHQDYVVNFRVPFSSNHSESAQQKSILRPRSESFEKPFSEDPLLTQQTFIDEEQVVPSLPPKTSWKIRKSVSQTDFGSSSTFDGRNIWGPSQCPRRRTQFQDGRRKNS